MLYFFHGILLPTYIIVTIAAIVNSKFDLFYVRYIYYNKSFRSFGSSSIIHPVQGCPSNFVLLLRNTLPGSREASIAVLPAGQLYQLYKYHPQSKLAAAEPL